jgi:hypothetical protein
MNRFPILLFYPVLLFILLGNLQAIGYEAGLEVGYKGGPGFQLNGLLSNFADELPVLIQGGIAYNRINPGNAADARRIFINNATNGDPQKSGRIWDFHLDFLYRVNWFSLSRAYVFAGTRYSMFKGNFKYIGGNEDFDITSDQWGFGTGLKTFFRMNRKMDFVLTGGLDYYLSNTLSGHDTSYSPDGEHVNAREDYGFNEADNAINQPKFQFRIMMGINYHFTK